MQDNLDGFIRDVCIKWVQTEQFKILSFFLEDRLLGHLLHVS